MIKQAALWIVRSLLVGVTYLAGLIIIGMGISMLGIGLGSTSRGADLLPWLFVGGVIVGLVLGPIASQLSATPARHIVVWTFVIFLNLISVIIEGSFFAPAQVGNNVPALVFQQLISSVLVASVLTWLFARKSSASGGMPRRAWYDWAWRFVGSAVSYLLFYFIFGAVNYALVTKPYYDSHAGGLTTPAPETVFIAEIIRGVMIALSVLPFLLTVAKPPRERAILTGLILFAVGGIVPLLYQVATLPILLLVASGIEIFFQNMSTGIVTALLLGRTSQAR